jgi:hypothetical protein
VVLWELVPDSIPDQGAQLIEVGEHGPEPVRKMVAQAFVHSLVIEARNRIQSTFNTRVLGELLPAALHSTEVQANNLLETDHGRLKARLRPMRGLKRARTARVIIAGHAFIQNLRRGFYDLGTDVRPTVRVANAFAELALAI